MSTVSETMEVREESSDSSQEQREVELSLTGGKEENFREVPGLAKIKMGMRNSLDRKTPSLLVERFVISFLTSPLFSLSLY